MCTTITYYTCGYDSVKMDLVRYPEMAPERPGAAYSTSSTFSIPGESAFSLVQPSSRSTASWDISSSPLYSSRRSYEELTPPEDYSLYRCRELSSPSNTMLLEQGNSSNSPIKLELDSSSTGITSFYRNQESLERYKSIYGVEGEPYRQPSSHWEAASGTEVGVIVTHQQQQQRTQRRLSRGGVRRRSGCSSADRAPSPSVMKKRRLAANARERRRMNGLNEAFDRLREVIPSLGEDHKLSKFETLQMAQTYISALCDLLDRGKR